MEKLRFYLYGVLVLLVVGFSGGFYTAWKYKPRTVEYYETLKPVTVIKTRVLTKIRYKTRWKTKTNTKIVYVPSEGSVEIRPKDPEKELEDVVEVKVKWYGLTFKPGFQLGVLGISYGPDFKLAYLNRFGLNTGVLLYPKTSRKSFHVSPSLGLSYKLDRVKLIDNTEIAITYTPLHLVPVNIGFRINL